MQLEEVIVGGGCFWCLEAVFERVEGVVDVENGYANGNIPNPDYRSVCSGETGYAEVVKITYDPEIVSLDRLFDIFFSIHDPTSLDRQGADIGTQYRSCICYTNDEQQKAAKEALERAQKRYDKPIVTKIEPLRAYYAAEPYHQDYFRKNPLQAYCQAVIVPKVEKFDKLFGVTKK